MKIASILSMLTNQKDLGVLFIRLAFGYRLVYGTIDNLLSYEQMLHFRDFLAFHRFPVPIISAFLSIVVQFLAGFSFITGVWIRFFSLLMILNFTTAILMVHIKDSYLNAAPAIHLLVISFFLLVYGAGKWTIFLFLKK